MSKKSIIQSFVVFLLISIFVSGVPITMGNPLDGQYIEVSDVELGADSAALPTGWQSLDIGTIGGSAAEIDGIWAVSADGADIWGGRDEFHYAFTTFSGDGTIIACVLDNGIGSDTWAKGGVMIRETLEPDSKFAMMFVSGGSGSGKAFQHRPITGERSFSAHGGDQVYPPMWVKLTRIDNTFTGYYSFDGINWIEQENWSLDGGVLAVNPATIEMATDVYIGLFVTSHRSGEIRTYTFDNVSVFKPVVDVTAPGDLVQGVPNDGITHDSGDFGWYRWESPDLAVDDNVETKFLHFKGEIESTGLRITPSVGPTIVTGLTLTTANDFPERDPIAFELSGSNVGIDGPYQLIARGHIVDFDQPIAWPRYTMNATPISFYNDMSYEHYQILFPPVRDSERANSMQIAEVELLGLPAPDGANIIPIPENVIEDFETNDFSKFQWNRYGYVNWETTSLERYSGLYSARSGSIGDGENSTLQVCLDCVSGHISFYCKVSSESPYDRLIFKIDDVEKGFWSGEEDWFRVSFPVDEGTRTFEWTYLKDSSISEGDDSAWIDYIVFPIGL